MADEKKMATREGYGRGLVALGAAHEDVVVLDADLAGSTKTGMFAKAYPDRHFNCGIAEADMMCVAAGFAANGFVPFASSFAMFAAGRAFEQIRNSIGYPHLNVKIGATHGGLSVGEDGASHQCCEDFALMRSIPGMVVICPPTAWRLRRLSRRRMNIRGRSTCGWVVWRFRCSTRTVLNSRSARARSCARVRISPSLPTV